ncbi:MAG: hypothetical protein K8S54_05475 [Spirochaetia bacterium]|nr:hypothetical protein [Spirochaetia bacterium]
MGEFEYSAPIVIVTSGRIRGNHDLVRKNWPVDRLGPAPQSMIAGGYHGYDALEGTFLGGFIFSGLHAGRHAARLV